MKNITKKILSIPLVTSFAFANGVSIDSIGLNIGVQNTNYTQNNATTLIDKPSENFNSYELFTTLKPMTDLCKQKDMKPYISYTYSSNSDMKHQYFLLGVNRYYKYNDIQYYAGVLTGYGELKWRYNPLNSTINSDHTSTSLIAGLQGGLNYPIDKQYSLNLNMKYLVHNYETDLKPSTTVNSTIEHDSTASVSLGVVYRF